MKYICICCNLKIDEQTDLIEELREALCEACKFNCMDCPYQTLLEGD